MAYVQKYETVDTPTFYKYREKHLTVGRPVRYVENKPYYARQTFGQANPSHPAFSLAAYGGFELSTNAKALLQSRAYANFVEALKGDTASVGNALGEWRSSYEMIARRAIQLRSALRAFRRGQVVQAARILSVPEDSVRKARVLTRAKRGRWRNADGGVSARHWASSLWLETYFGWLPMINDVHDALTILSDPIRNLVDVKGKSTSQAQEFFQDYRASDGRGELYRGNTRSRANYYAKVEVTNPNLFLANRMGLVNPASIAWELVPFSFVVDWFTNVGQIIESMTDFAGLAIVDSGYSVKTQTNMTYQYFGGVGGGRIGVVQQVNAASRIFQRTPGPIDRPPVAFRSPLGDWKRAATQISLLNSYISIDRTAVPLRTR